MNVQQVGQTYGGHNTHGCTLLVYSKSATHTRWASHPRLYVVCVQPVSHTHNGQHTHCCTLLEYSKSATHTMGITPTAAHCLHTAVCKTMYSLRVAITWHWSNELGWPDPYMHRIWPYFWWFSCQKKRIYTVYIGFRPTLQMNVKWVGQKYSGLQTYGCTLLYRLRVEGAYVGLARTIHTYVYTVYTFFWQGNHHTYGHIRCVYTRFWPTLGIWFRRWHLCCRLATHLVGLRPTLHAACCTASGWQKAYIGLLNEQEIGHTKCWSHSKLVTQ